MIRVLRAAGDLSLTTRSRTRREACAIIAQAVAIGSLAAIAGGCSSTGNTSLATTAALPSTTPDDTDPGAKLQAGLVKAALLLPLTGGPQMALVAKSMQQAAELALFERNTPSFQLIVKDDKGTAEGAAQAATAAIAEGAELILGPLLAVGVAAVAPLARQAQVPVIAFSNDPANGGNGIHLLSFFVADEVHRATAHAIEQGRRQFAALIPKDPLGRDSEPVFRKAVEQGGARIAMLESYTADMGGMVEAGSRVFEALKADADGAALADTLFLPSTSDNVARLTAMLRHNGFEGSRAKLVLTQGWDTPAALREPRLHGAWLAGPEPKGWTDFSARFGRAYNAAPARIASLAYDAVTVATAFSNQPKGSRYTSANLTRASGFSGIDGPFRLTPKGPSERSLAILEIQPQGLVVVAAPKPFESLGSEGAVAQVSRQQG